MTAVSVAQPDFETAWQVLTSSQRSTLTALSTGSYENVGGHKTFGFGDLRIASCSTPLSTKPFASCPFPQQHPHSRAESTMHEMAPGDVEALGQALWDGAFLPLPEVDADGVLVGVRLWRVRNGMVEQILFRHNGAAQAVRAFAQFSYRQPFDHGPVVEIRSGHPVNALHWLLDTGRNWPANP
jgi:hypothetical protein